MKKVFALILAVCMLLAMCACGGQNQNQPDTSGAADADNASDAANRLEAIQAAGKIVMATSPDYPPYEFEDLSKTGQDAYVGADIEVARYIAEQLGVDLEIKAMGFDATLAAVTEGTVDIALAGLTDREDRRTKMDFSTPYYVEGDQVMVVLAENADKFASLADFETATIVGQNGSYPMEAAQEAFPNATLNPVTQITDGLLMVKEGKADAMVLTEASANTYTANDDGLAITAHIEGFTGQSIVVAVVKGETELLDAINELTDTINQDGLFLQWLDEANDLKAELDAAA